MKKFRFNQRLSPFAILQFAVFVASFASSPKKICFHSQNKGQLIFEDKWPAMEPVVLKLLLQDHVDNS
jgi:hypothetical protein